MSNNSRRGIFNIKFYGNLRKIKKNALIIEEIVSLKVILSGFYCINFDICDRQLAQ